MYYDRIVILNRSDMYKDVVRISLFVARKEKCWDKNVNTKLSRMSQVFADIQGVWQRKMKLERIYRSDKKMQIV